jgi:hypothetical protein
MVQILYIQQIVFYRDPFLLNHLYEEYFFQYSQIIQLGRSRKVTIMLTLCISVFVFNTLAILMLKKISALEYYGSIFFGIFLADISDRFADKYNLYYFFQPKVVETQTFLILLGVYPAASMMIINWFPYRESRTNKALYILAWSLFSVIYEWLALESGFLHYVHWKLWYSALSYPFLYSGLMLNLYFIRWLNKKSPIELV